jgi:hypothetical protein
MDIEKFHPKNIKHLYSAQLLELSQDDVRQLAEAYPIMHPELHISKVGAEHIINVATYKSAYSLMRTGYKFKIVGTKFGDPVLSTPEEEILEVVEQLHSEDYVEPENKIFNPKPKINEQGITFEELGIGRRNNIQPKRGKSTGGRKQVSRGNKV